MAEILAGFCGNANSSDKDLSFAAGHWHNQVIEPERSRAGLELPGEMPHCETEGCLKPIRRPVDLTLYFCVRTP